MCDLLLNFYLYRRLVIWFPFDSIFLWSWKLRIIFRIFFKDDEQEEWAQVLSIIQSCNFHHLSIGSYHQSGWKKRVNFDTHSTEPNRFDFSFLKLDQEALREQYPSLSIGCFIRKPVTMENLVRRVKAELE